MSFGKFALTLGLGLPTVIFGAVAAAGQPAHAPALTPVAGLGTSEQVRREKLALEVLATPQVREQLRRVEALYAADPQGATPTGKVTIGRAAHSITMAAIYMAIAEDLTRPYPFWSVNAPHEWFGIKVPRAGFGIDNPDNVYSPIRIEGGVRYEVRGRIRQPGPVELHFELRDSVPGTGPMVAEAGQQLATLRSDEIAVQPDGSFVITIDSDPVAGRTNHIATPASGSFHMSVRQLFTDWGTQNPISLEVVRLSGAPPKQPLTVAQIADRSVELLKKIAPFWVAYDNRFIFSQPANYVRPPRARPGGRGLSANGHFTLKPDEAWVITLDPLGALSLGVQITDPWGVAYDYVNRTSSLNNVQATPNADGTYTFVVAQRDPGVHNWLDPEGHDAGMLAIRWQSLPQAAKAETAIRGTAVVPLARLREVLPPETHFLNPGERQTQQAQRAASYAHRLR